MKPDHLKMEGEALFEAVLNTVSDAITVIDKDLKVIFQNEAVHKAYGSRIGESCFETYRGRQEPCENCIILQVMKDGNPRRALRDIQLPDGKIRWMEISSGPGKCDRIRTPPHRRRETDTSGTASTEPVGWKRCLLESQRFCLH